MKRTWRFPGVVATGLVLAGCAAVLGIDDVTYLLGADAGDAGTDGAVTDAPGNDPDGACGADLDNDPANCGGCGHDCGGSACVKGACQPIPFPYAYDRSPRAIAVTADALYAGHYSDDGGVVRFELDGGNPTVLARGYAGYFATARGRLYYTTWGSGALWSVPLDGGEARLEATLSATAFGLLLREDKAGHLIAYVGRYGDSTESGVWSVDLSDGGIVQPVHTGESPSQIATDGTRIYWADQGSLSPPVPSTGVWSYDLTTKETRHLVATGSRPFGVAVHGEHVYFTEQTSVPTRISRAPADGGLLDAGEVFAQLPSGVYPSDLIVRDGFFWVAGGTQIYRLGVDGGAAKTLASGLAGATQLVLDDRFIYWTETGGNVQKLRRPID